MKWIKEILVDILVTIAVILAVRLPYHWLELVIVVYTPIMLLMKAVVLFSGGFNQLMKKTQTSAPWWFVHLLYAINVIVLFFAQWWITGAEWILIWLLSYLTHLKIEKKSVASSKKKNVGKKKK